MINIAKLFITIKRNSNAKTIVGNFAWLSILQIISYAMPLITIPYLARVIGTDGVGYIAFASAVTIWIQTIADWGYYLTAVRDISLVRNDKKAVNKIFSTVMYSKAFLTLSCGFLLYGLTIIIPVFRENRTILLFAYLMIPGQVLCADWLFQGLERMKYMTLVNLISKSIFTILIFIIIKNYEDYVYQPLLLSSGYILAGIFSQMIIICKYKVRYIFINITDIFRSIKSSTDVFINTLMPNFYNSFSIVLLGFLGGPYYTGIYSAGYKLINVSNSLFQVVSRTFFPFLSRKIQKHYIYSKISIYLSIVCVVILFLGAPLFIKILYGNEFAPSVPVLRILSVSIFFLILSDVYGKNYLVLIHKEKVLRNITLVSSLIGFSLSFPLVYYFKDIGVALTYIISIGMMGIGAYSYSKKIKSYNN